MKECLRVIKGLSDPSRLKIIKMLMRKEMCVCEIQALLGLAQPTISKHLKILEEAGLVDRRKDKTWVNYRVAEGSSPYAADMLALMEKWLEDDPEIAALVRQAASVDRNLLCNGKRSA